MRQFLSLKGINWWLLASAVGLNFIWSGAVLFAVAFLLGAQGAFAGGIQVGMLLACFGLPFLIAWLIAAMAGDGLGPNYGIYGSLGAAVPLLIVVGSSGIFGVILALTTFLGGLNGGMLSMRRKGRG